MVGSESRQASGPPVAAVQQSLPPAVQPSSPSMLYVHMSEAQTAEASQFGPPSVARMTYFAPAMPSMAGGILSSVAAVGVPPLAGMAPRSSRSSRSVGPAVPPG